MPEAPPRIVVITGATRGLGRAMTSAFAAAGHTIFGCGRDEMSIDELRAEFPSPHRFDRVDVADDGQAADWAKSVLATATPDLLLNNAAVVNRNAPLWNVPADEFSRVIDVNVKGTANVLRHFLPAMISKRKGVIVNFSSGWGRSTSPEVAPYCATKYAVEGLTLALSQELPDGMAAIALNPGVIDTEMLRSCFGGDARHYPSPEKWARTAVPYILDLSARHNGQSLSVPGM